MGVRELSPRDQNGQSLSLRGQNIGPPQAEILGIWDPLLRRKHIPACTLERGFLCKMDWELPNFPPAAGVDLTQVAIFPAYSEALTKKNLPN